ncbi:S8 family serine peptidase [Myxococcota bacterium]|nr:S8 family serine peptidase [Myxococcota bacterium]
MSAHPRKPAPFSPFATSATLTALLAAGCAPGGGDATGSPEPVAEEAAFGGTSAGPSLAVGRATVRDGAMLLADGSEARPGEVVVALDPEAHVPFDPRVAGLRAEPLARTDRGSAALYAVDGDEPVEVAAERLSRLPGVLFAEPNRIRRASALPSGSDPYREFQWNLDAVGVDAAWEHGSGEGVVVAVLDTGLSLEGADSPAHIAAGVDVVNGDADPTDDNGHGTHVTGTIAQATGNGVGCAGVAPGATVMPVKVLAADGSGTTFDLVLGIAWAVENGADVINMSLGGFSPSPLETQAVQAAREAGVVVVAASGNDATPHVAYPAGYPGVIAVGAFTFGNLRADYSNWGRDLDLLAPGGDLEMDRDQDGLVDGILQEAFGPTWGYYLKQGTSMAAPHVAAAAAILKGMGVEDPAEVEALLRLGARDLWNDGFDPMTGYGRLDIPRSIDLALAEPSPPPLYMGKVEVRRLGDRVIARFATSEPALPAVRFVTSGDELPGSTWATEHEFAFTAPVRGPVAFQVVAVSEAGLEAISNVLAAVPGASDEE